MIAAYVKHGWTQTRLWTAALLGVLGFVVTFPAWADIYQIAVKDEEASHIFLVPLVMGWLIWVRRGRFRHCQPRGTFVGPALVALGWAVSTWGYHHAVQSLWHGGAVLVVVGCVLAALGWDVLVRFLPAFVLLAFLVPIPGMIRQQIAIPLQRATAQVTQVLFDLGGLPVERSGNMLSINGTAVEIAEACNGLRMVFALVLVSYGFAFGEPLRNYVRVLIVVASPLSAILCNVVRMLPTLWLYGYGPRTVADGFHSVAGWVMLALAFMMLMGIIRLLRWAYIPVAHYTLASQ
jgi:exosortase